MIMLLLSEESAEAAKGKQTKVLLKCFGNFHIKLGKEADKYLLLNRKGEFEWDTNSLVLEGL